MRTSFAENGKNSGSNAIIIAQFTCSYSPNNKNKLSTPNERICWSGKFQCVSCLLNSTYQRINDSSSCLMCQWHKLKKMEKINVFFSTELHTFHWEKSTKRIYIHFHWTITRNPHIFWHMQTKHIQHHIAGRRSFTE